MLEVKIEPWEAVQNFEIATLHGRVKLKEEGSYVVYEASDYGSSESVEYKFKLLKRGNWREYMKDFVEVDVPAVDLNEVVGMAARFREVYQRVASLFRIGYMASASLRWRDGSIEALYELYASRERAQKPEEAVVRSWVRLEHGDEFASLVYDERTADPVDTMEKHTERAIGLYTLFKEYVLQDEESSKA